MTADELLETLLTAGAPTARGPVEPVRRRCVGGTPAAPCSVLVDRRAEEGLCGACRAARLAEQRRAEDAALEQELLDALPELHHDAAFGAPSLASWCRDAEATAQALSVAETWPRPLRTVLFTGPTNAGKSTLAAAVVRALRRGRRRTASIAWLDARVLAGVNRRDEKGAALIERATSTRILVVDDLAKELHRLEFEVQQLVEVLEARHARLPELVPPDAVTLITTEREVRPETGRDSDGKDLVSCYPLSFVRRIAGAWNGDGDAPRGSALVIPVRRRGS